MFLIVLRNRKKEHTCGGDSIIQSMSMADLNFVCVANHFDTHTSKKKKKKKRGQNIYLLNNRIIRKSLAWIVWRGDRCHLDTHTSKIKCKTLCFELGSVENISMDHGGGILYTVPESKCQTSQRIHRVAFHFFPTPKFLEPFSSPVLQRMNGRPKDDNTFGFGRLGSRSTTRDSRTPAAIQYEPACEL